MRDAVQHPWSETAHRAYCSENSCRWEYVKGKTATAAHVAATDHAIETGHEVVMHEERYARVKPRTLTGAFKDKESCDA